MVIRRQDRHRLAGAVCLSILSALTVRAASIRDAQIRIDGVHTQSMALTATDARAAYWEGEFEVSVAVTNLSVGAHWLETRFQASHGVWSAWQGQWFRVTGGVHLVAAEYFIDSDPGPGNGTAIRFPADGAWDEPEEDLEVTAASVAGLSATNRHTLYVRAKDSQGDWGLVSETGFYVAAPLRMVAAEWTTDPAAEAGTGRPLDAADGLFDEAEEDLVATPDSALLGRAFCQTNTVYVRVKDSLGRWSSRGGLWWDSSNSVWRFDPGLGWTATSRGGIRLTPERPSQPAPPHGGLTGNRLLSLGWKGCVGAASYSAYFWEKGSAGEPVLFTDWTGTNYADGVTMVSPGKRYGWRLRSVAAPDCYTDGPAWEFTVAYRLTALAGPNGTVTPGTANVAPGGSQKFVIRPNAGYHIDSVKVNNVSVGCPSVLVVTNITADQSVRAAFDINRYPVTIRTEGPGWISPTNAAIPHRGSQTFSILPDTGHHVAEVVVDGQSMGPRSSHTFTNVVSERMIGAWFAPNRYTVTATHSSYGFVAPQSAEVEYGGSCTFTVVPNTGYAVSDLLVNGRSAGARSEYTFVNVASNQALHAVFGVRPPAADFVAETTSGQLPLSVRFADLSDGPVSGWVWDFNHDGAVDSTEQRPEPWVYASAGAYSVRLTVSGPGGASTLVRTNYISVTTLPMPAASFTAAPTTGAAPVDVVFSDQSTGSIAVRYWDFENDGVIDAVNPAAPVRRRYERAGEYTVKLTVVGQGGTNSAVRAGYIRVAPPPTNRPPVLVAARQQIHLRSLGDMAELDARGTYDPDGDPVFFSWREDYRNPVLGLVPIGSETVSNLPVYFPTPGRYRFEVQASDGLDVSPAVRAISVYAPGLAGTVNVAPSDVVRLPDARVAAYGSAQDATRTNNPVGVALSDSFGRFTMDNLSPAGTNTARNYYLTLERAGYVSPAVQQFSVRPDPMEGPATYSLGRGTAPVLAGAAVDSAGRPLENVTVTVFSGIGGQPLSDTTGADGRFEIRNAPYGSWPVQLLAYAYRSEVRDVNIGAGSTNFTFSLREASAAGVLSGQVTLTGTDRPVPDVRVLLADGTQRFTDAEGRYRFEGLPVGAYLMVFSKGGYETKRLTTVRVGLGTNAVDVGLAPSEPVTVVGTVFDAISGRAVHRATVGVESTAGLQVVSDISDPTGYFRLPDVPTGYRSFRVSAAGYAPKTFEAFVSRGVRQEIRLARAANWRAPRRPGAGLPAARVARPVIRLANLLEPAELDGSPSTGGALTYLWRESPDNPVLNLIPDGAASMDRITVAGFAKPGVYVFELQVRGDGGVSPTPASVVVFAPGLAGNVHVSPSDRLFGLFQVTVRAYTNPACAVAWDDHFADSKPVGDSPLGDFVLDGVSTGVYWIVAREDLPMGYRPYGPVRRAVNYSSGAGRVMINMSRDSAALRGAVLDAATRAPIENVSVMAASGAFSEMFRTTTDASGAFALHGIPSGTQSILFMADGYQASMRPMNVFGGGPETVTLNPNSAGTSALLRGRISVNHRGIDLPVAQAEIVVGTGVARTFTDSEGRYEFRALPPGNCFATVRKPGYRPARLFSAMVATLLPGVNTADQVLAFEGRGPAIRGIVVSEAGDAIPGVKVSVAGEPGGTRAADEPAPGGARLHGEPVNSDAAGVFLLDDVPDGPRRVRMELPDGRVITEPIRVNGNMEMVVVAPEATTDPYTRWLGRYYGAPYPGDGADTDGDGVPTREEYWADTVPTNARSRFGPDVEAPARGVWRFLLDWSSTGRLYRVQWNTNLVSGRWFEGFRRPGTGGALSVSVTNDVTRPRCFYRASVRLP